MLRLVDLPETHGQLLEQHHDGSVERFLYHNPQIYDLGRFRAFLAGLKLITRKKVRSIGVEMTIQLSKADNRDRIGAAVKLAQGFFAERRAYPDHRRAYRLAVQARARVPKPPSSEQQTIEQLLAERAKLLAEIRGLKLENRRLRLELRRVAPKSASA